MKEEPLKNKEYCGIDHDHKLFDVDSYFPVFQKKDIKSAV
ncbi:unnamed protein product, partial [marine sediment metagenome]